MQQVHSRSHVPTTAQHNDNNLNLLLVANIAVPNRPADSDGSLHTHCCLPKSAGMF